MPPKNQPNEGFTLADVKKNELTIAFLSLRSALKAWFSTYQALGWLHKIEKNKKQITQHIPIDYFEHYSKAVFHFHHFFELIIKDSLRNEHELLVLDSSIWKKDSVLLWKIITNEKLTNEEKQKNTIPFNDALELIKKFTNKKIFTNTIFLILKDNQTKLENLNKHRNNLAHRGNSFLEYYTLDSFIGENLLSILLQILELPEYKEHEKIWKYQKLSSKIDPLTILGEEFSQGDVDFRKVALLKELGRAAYRNPLRKGMMFDFLGSARAKNSAKIELENGGAPIDKMFHCPICGNESLVRFFEYVTHDPEEEDLIEHTKIKCYGCTFELYNNLGEISAFGLGLENFWQPNNSDLRPS